MENAEPSLSQGAVSAGASQPNPELLEKMAAKSDQELLEMFAAPDDWRPESLEAARAELQKRKIPEPLNTADAPFGEAERIETASNLPPPVIKKCFWCGRENAGEAEHCDQCGTKLDQVTDSPDVSLPAGVAIPAPDSAPPLITKSSPVRAGLMCVQHPKVQATQQCRRCGAFMCATCDFAFPGDIHFCPTCVARGDEGLIGKRKQFMIWSLVLAAWSTIGMACLVSGAMSSIAQNKEERTVLGWVLIIFVLGPAITGLALAMTSKRKTANPSLLWIALVWNAVLVASYVVLTLIGLSRE